MAAERVLVIDDSPTIVRVVQLVLTKAGFVVEAAADGEAGLAAARANRPDLILLDFVMPKMNGYQVCRELAADPALREIPVVLMSAKGDQVGERFVKVMGIVDYITKPFSPEAITAVVQHTVGKYRSGDSGRSDGVAPAEVIDPTSGRARALAALRAHLTDVVAARVAALFALADAADGGGEGDARVPTDAGAIADTVRSALDDDALAQVVAGLDPAVFDGESLRGDLRVIPLAEIVQLLDHQEQSGVLTVMRNGARIDVYFRRGRIDQALGTGLADDLLLGRYIVDGELMPRGDFDAFLASRAGAAKLIGEQLVRLGHLSVADRRTALARQTSELLYEALRWRYGTFAFVAGSDAPAPVVEAALELDVEALLMEGFRRVDEWHLIERAIDDFELVFLRNEDAVAQMGRGRLTREELAVLEQVNGKNTVKDIVRKSRMGSFEVSKMLYRLLSIKLVRRRVLPVAV
ncbi:MAG: response regulator [Myxococcales bacterium]|nr:response regulator [Myxococcales bacterium]